MTLSATARPWITSGIVLVSAGAAVVPAVAPVAVLPSPAPAVAAVQLTAFDPNNWTDVLNAALANGTDVWDHVSPAPAPALHQVLANQTGYLEALLNGSKTFDQVVAAMNANLSAAGDASLAPFMPSNPADFIYSSLDPASSEISIKAIGYDLFDIPLPGKAGLLDLLTNGLQFDLGLCPLCTHITIPILSLLVGSDTAAQIEPYLNFLGSPLSGVLWGEIGVTLGPILQIKDDVTDIINSLSGASPDWNAALTELLDMPANLTNALLNGYGEVSLTALLAEFGLSIPGLNASLDFDLGGLLSPGGSLLNGLGFSTDLGDCSIVCAAFDVPTSAVGPIASMIEMAQAMAEAIGWNGAPFDSLLSLFS